MLKEVTATRYVTPLREGGSLPGLVEADDLGTYVMKFTGAGQGRKTLVAEVICGELARRLGLRVPGLVTLAARPGARVSASPTRRSRSCSRPAAALNLGMDFLSGSLGFDPLAFEVSPTEAGRVVWFDALDQQRRPVLAQPQHADVARRPVAHRPRRHDDLAPQLARRRGLRRQAVRRLRPRARAVRPGHRRGRRRTGARWSPRNCSPRSPPRSPTSGWRTSPASTRRTRCGGPTRQPLLARAAVIHERDQGRSKCNRAAHRASRAGEGDGERDVFEYALLRVVPRIERGECFNAGVLVYCRAKSFVGARTHLDEAQAAGAGPRGRRGRGAGRAARRRGGLRGRRAPPVRRRRRRGAALPLADRAALDGGPAGPGAHGADRRSGRRGGTAARPAGR